MKSYQKLSYAVIAAAGVAFLQGCGDSTTTSGNPDGDDDFYPEGECAIGSIKVDGECQTCESIHGETSGLLMNNEAFNECVTCFSIDHSTPIFRPPSEEDQGGCEPCPEYAPVFMFGVGVGNRCVNATYAQISDRLTEVEEYAHASEASSVARFVHVGNRQDAETMRLDELWDQFEKFKKWVRRKIREIEERLDIIEQQIIDILAAIELIKEEILAIWADIARVEEKLDTFIDVTFENYKIEVQNKLDQKLDIATFNTFLNVDLPAMLALKHDVAAFNTFISDRYEPDIKSKIDLADVKCEKYHDDLKARNWPGGDLITDEEMSGTAEEEGRNFIVTLSPKNRGDALCNRLNEDAYP